MCVTTPMASADHGASTHTANVSESRSPSYFAVAGKFHTNHKSTVQRKHRPPNLDLPSSSSSQPGIQAIRMPNSASVPKSIPLLGLSDEDHSRYQGLTSDAPPCLSTPVFRAGGSLSASSANIRYRSPSLPMNVLQPTTPVDIPSFIEPMSCAEAAPLVGQQNVFFVDIRPFKHYCISRINSAINICIPSTLLKRPNYLLSRFAECMAPEHRHKLSDFSQYSHVIIYDDDSVEANGLQPNSLTYTLAKFGKVPELANKLYYLEGGFKQMETEFPHTVSKSSMAASDSSPCQSRAPGKLSLSGNGQDASLNTNHRQTLSLDGLLQPPSFANSRHKHKMSNDSATSINSDTTGSTAPSSTSPVLCGFSLPTLSISEMKPSISAKSLSNVNYDYDYDGVQLSMPEMTPHNQDKLPAWLKPITGPDGSKLLAHKFKDIQQAEKARLEGMFAPGDDPNKYSISKAVEHGHKNRYNNIWPYDHARVVLNKAARQDDVPPSPSCDYINASYIAASTSHKRYIATQAPIPETFKDFWQVVWDESCVVIMMLTAVAEGGFLKSHTYWETGRYGIFQLSREVDDEEVDLCPQTESKVTIRKFVLTHIPTGKTHHVVQIHYTDWPDLGTPVSAFDLLALCQMKTELTARWKRLHNMNPECGEDREPISIIHCSAGCGRTGTFCTIDSVIDILSCKSLAHADHEKQDVIFDIVNEFRCQRLSMVQSMRQYAMCYEAVGLWCILNR